MYSSQSVDGNKWTPQHQSGDAVLDVKDIARYGRMLGPKVTEFEVQEGMHDLVLSKPSARQAAYSEMFRWLRSNGLNEPPKFVYSPRGIENTMWGILMPR